MQIEFPGLLALIFITLKLTGHITWLWIWVLSPIWIVFLIAAVLTFLEISVERKLRGRR